jgi:hypothetical protein
MPPDARNVLCGVPGFLKANDLPVVWFGELRHSRASLRLSHGVSFRRIMEILGHSQSARPPNHSDHARRCGRRRDAALGAS